MQSQIIISPRGKLMSMIPHYLLVDGQLLGIIKGGEVRVNLPSGIYHVTIRSMYKFIESTIEVYIPINETKHLTFRDRDKWWNWLFNIDLVLWIIKRLIHVPEPWGTIYEVLSNGFFAVWLLRIWIIRKRYFKITEEIRKMKRIGIISDTHGFWDPKYEKYLGECDEIWHAGDIGSIEVADKFDAMKPVFRAVYGNCDGYDLRARYPEIQRFICEDVDVMIKHIGGYPGKYDRSVIKMLYASPPQLFIAGHSHILKVKFDKTLNLLHINPGAAGMMGWQKERTLVRLTIDGSKFTDCEVITLGKNNNIL